MQRIPVFLRSHDHYTMEPAELQERRKTNAGGNDCTDL